MDASRTPVLGEVVSQLMQALPSQQGNLAYHNWSGHVLNVVEDVTTQCDALEARNYPIDRLVAVIGAMIHELWEHIPLSETPYFNSKEHRSSVMSIGYLVEAGLTLPRIQSIGGAVLGTSECFPLLSPEAVVLHRGDTNNVRDYSTFLPANYLLKREIEQASGCHIPFTVWQRGGISKLDALIGRDRPLDAYDLEPGDSGLTWHQTAYLRTRERFLHETPETYAEQLGIPIDDLL